MAPTYKAHGTVSRGFEIELEMDTDDEALVEEAAENAIVTGDTDLEIPDDYTWRITDVERVDE